MAPSKKMVKKVLDGLTSQKKAVLCGYIDPVMDEKNERVRQIEAKALRKLALRKPKRHP